MSWTKQNHLNPKGIQAEGGAMFLQDKNLVNSEWLESRDGAYPVNKIFAAGRYWHQAMIRNVLYGSFSFWSKENLESIILDHGKSIRGGSLALYLEPRGRTFKHREAYSMCIDDLILDHSVFQKDGDTLEYFINIITNKTSFNKPNTEIPIWTLLWAF